MLKAFRRRLVAWWRQGNTRVTGAMVSRPAPDSERPFAKLMDHHPQTDAEEEQGSDRITRGLVRPRQRRLARAEAR